MRFQEDSRGPGKVTIRRGGMRNWPGPNTAQPGGRDAPMARMSTGAHPFAPRVRAARQAEEKKIATFKRGRLGIYGPQDKKR